MQIRDYTYHRPRTLAEACTLGQDFGAEGRYLAGGTELLVDLKNRRDSADHVISLRDVAELKQISRKNSTLRIGALASLAAVAESPEVQQTLPALREAILQMGGQQIRNQGTIGGNFCRAVPCADTPPICIVAETQLRLVGTERERTIPAEDFFQGPRRTVLASGELLAEILIPAQPANSGASYQRFALRGGMALAVAAVAARVVIEKGEIADARLALNSVAPIPLPAVKAAKAVIGQKPGADIFDRAGQIAAKEAQPITDLRGSEQFRRDLVKVLTVRALTQATARAQGDSP